MTGRPEQISHLTLKPVTAHASHHSEPRREGERARFPPRPPPPPPPPYRFIANSVLLTWPGDGVLWWPKRPPLPPPEKLQADPAATLIPHVLGAIIFAHGPIEALLLFLASSAPPPPPSPPAAPATSDEGCVDDDPMATAAEAAAEPPAPPSCCCRRLCSSSCSCCCGCCRPFLAPRRPENWRICCWCWCTRVLSSSPVTFPLAPVLPPTLALGASLFHADGDTPPPPSASTFRRACCEL